MENNVTSLDILKSRMGEHNVESFEKLIGDMNETKTRFEDLLEMTSLISVDSKKASLTNIALKERVEKAKKTFNLIINDYEIDVDFSQIPNNLIVHNIYEAELYTILLNVLSNSIKSVIAGRGKKSIRITALKERDRNKIIILDTGVGISKEKYDDVFVPFIADPDNNLYRKLEQNLNPADKYIVGTGSGLGLSIVKEIVDAREGTISFKQPENPWKARLEIELP